MCTGRNKSKKDNWNDSQKFQKIRQKNFLIIYKTCIRTQLEYCILAWSPHLVKYIEVWEKVQRAATRLVPELGKLEYNKRLRRLDLTTLVIRGDLKEKYKIPSGKERMGKDQFFQLSANEHGLRGHSVKICKQ